MTNLVKNLPPRSWRSEAAHDRYTAERVEVVASDTCPLCSRESIQEYEYWRVIKNKYPYDSVAKEHDMIIPKRHTAGSDLTEAELNELSKLKNADLNNNYSFILEAVPKAKSVPGHFHLHLIVPKIVE